MNKLDRVLSLVDWINQSIGKIVGYIVLVLIVVILYEISMRHIFSASQSWTFETSQFLFGAAFVLGGAYTLYNRAHVNVDILYQRFSPKKKAIIDLITSIFILIYLGVLIWKGWDMAWRSFLIGETTESGWSPPIWPVRMLIPIGAFLMLLQAVSNIVRQTVSVFGKERSE